MSSSKNKAPISSKRLTDILMDSLCETVAEAEVVDAFEHIFRLGIQRELVRVGLSEEAALKAAQSMSQSMADSIKNKDAK